MAESTNKTGKNKNIQAAPPGSLLWDPADPGKSLTDLLRYVEGEADKAINWYWRNKRWKSLLSRYIQFGAVVLTAAGGIAPILVQLRKNAEFPSTFDSGLWASLCVGLAAALIGLDKAFGFSSGWARYVLAATSIHKALEEFRLDWEALSAVSSQPPQPEQIAGHIQRAKDFVSTVEGFVLQETKDWVSEFQSNMAQIEKEVKTQRETLKAETDKAVQTGKPGSIELTVPNADKADGFKFQVLLENQLGKVADESVVNTKSWVRINAAPAQYRLTISAAAGGKTIATSTVVEVKPGEVAKPEVMLLIS